MGSFYLPLHIYYFPDKKVLITNERTINLFDK